MYILYIHPQTLTYLGCKQHVNSCRQRGVKFRQALTSDWDQDQNPIHVRYSIFHNNHPSPEKVGVTIQIHPPGPL